MSHLGRDKRIHFIGIGGIGMSGIAEILLRSGYAVSGSDLKENPETQRLQGLGAVVSIGHRAENVATAEVLVISSAIARDNPEIVEGKRKGLPILARGEMLAELMRQKRSIVVAGAHGKTTTSAMIATILMESGADPTAVIGGRLRRISSNARVGTDEWFVAESDESDGSFLRMLPTIAVITNLDREHLNHYGTFDAIERAFVEFANRVPFDGAVVVCRDDPAAAAILPRIERPIVTYGIDVRADITGHEIFLGSDHSNFTIRKGKEKICDVRLPSPGRHNILNALAAASVGLEMGLEGGKIARGLGQFAGIERRLDLRGIERGIRVIDDYAHHPTEIRATLAALRLMAGAGAVRVLFQPHRYTRLQDLWEEFTSAFDAAEDVIVLPVYAASETPIRGIDSERLGKEIRSRGKTDAAVASSLEEGVRMIAARAASGDVLVTMGAGDVTRAGPLMLAELAGKMAWMERKA